MRRKIKDMSWPAPGKDMDSLEYSLRHSKEAISMRDRHMAADIIAAYKQMIFDPAKKRNMIIRELRQEGIMKGEIIMDNDLVLEWIEKEIEDIQKAVTMWGIHGVLRSFEDWLRRAGRLADIK